MVESSVAIVASKHNRCSCTVVLELFTRYSLLYSHVKPQQSI
jgi:hypothetical protein